jgi:regulator of protease activity HflC (stomatin/prohibitin superfamily)
VSAKRSRLPSGRCSPTEALNLLRPAFEPKDAADELTQAIHRRMPIIGNGIVIKSHIAPRLMVVAHEADGRWTARIEGTFAVGGVKPTDVWEFEIDKVKTLLPQPDTRAEAMQAATAAAEAARAEAATARAELEQARAALQAATEQMEQAEARAQAAEARAEAVAHSRPTTSNRRVVDEPRRKPGPKTKDDWPIQVAAELIQRVRAGEKMPTPAEMCQWCEENWGWQPDIRPMQRLFRVLLP